MISPENYQSFINLIDYAQRSLTWSKEEIDSATDTLLSITTLSFTKKRQLMNDLSSSLTKIQTTLDSQDISRNFLSRLQDHVKENAGSVQDFISDNNIEVSQYIASLSSSAGYEITATSGSIGTVQYCKKKEIPIYGYEVPSITPNGYSSEVSPTPRAVFLESGYATGYDGTAEQQAIRVAGDLSLLPEGKRSVYFVNPMESFTPNWSTQGNVNILRDGPIITRHQEWVFDFLTALKDQGITPDFIMLDEEFSPLGFFYLGSVLGTQPALEAHLATFYADPEIVRSMPPDVLAVTPHEIAYGSTNSPAILAYNQWVGAVRTRALKKVICDPIREVYGKNIPVNNYGDMKVSPDIQIYDFNGWKANLSRVASSSSPVTYTWYGNYQIIGRTKHPFWNALITSINYVRACAMSKTDQVYPWISMPSFGEGNSSSINVNVRIWVWKELLRHISRIYLDGLLYFSPSGGIGTDNATAGTVFNECSEIETVAWNLPQIPLDADQIVTLDYTTTYANFIANGG